jgi:hypothetical protein
MKQTLYALAIIGAALTFVNTKSASFDIMNDNVFGYLGVAYDFDFGYGTLTSFDVNNNTKLEEQSFGIGFYSNLDLYLSMNLFGRLVRNFKLETVPINIIPITATAAWTHPVSFSLLGEDLKGLLDFGYEVVIGDLQLYYFRNDLVPSISLLDYILGATNTIYPTTIFDASTNKGWAWSENSKDTWISDPVVKFNLADYIK